MANTHDIHVEVKADATNVSRELHKVVNVVKDVGTAAQQSDKGIAEINKALQAMVGYAQTSNNQLKNLNTQMRNLAASSRSAGKGLQDAGNSGESAQAVLSRVTAAAKGFIAVQIGVKVAEFGASCIQAGMQITKLKNSLEVLTGSAEKGRQTFDEFAKFAAETPFDTKEVIEYGKQMIAQGYAVNEVTKYLRVFGDTAAATGTDLGGVTLVMGQIRNSSKLMLQDVMQLQNRGVNVWQMLSDASGKSMAEMKEAVHEGTVSGAQAFEMLSSQMEKTFGGMMDKQAQSLEGAINELGETVDNLKASFGEWLAESLKLKDGIKSLTNGIKDLIGATEENRKAETDLTNVEAQTKKAIDDTKYVLEELTDDYHQGKISLQEYTEKTEKIQEGCEVAQNGLNTVGIAVSDLQGLMNKGIITAGQYAKAIASISYNAAQLRIAQEGLTNAIKSGDTAAQQGYLNRIEAINAATSTLANPSLNGDLENGGKLQKEIPGAASSKKNGTDKAAAEAKKKAMEELKASNKLKEEQLAAENRLKNASLQIQQESINTKLAYYQKYGTDVEKVNADMAQKEIDVYAKVLQEQRRFEEESLANKNRLAEAKASGTAADSEIKVLEQKLAISEKIHQANLNAIASEKDAFIASEKEKLQSNLERYEQTNSYEEQLEALKEERRQAEMDWLNAKTEQERLSAQEKIDGLNQQIEIQTSLQSLEQATMSAMSNGITNWIMGVTTFQDAMISAFKSILAQGIQMFTQLWLKQHVFSNLAARLSAREAASAVAQGASITAGLSAAAATRYAALLGPGGPAAAAGEIAAAASMIQGFSAASTAAGISGSVSGLKMATGGLVSGAGTGVSDSVPAMLSDGEYVLKASTVNALGTPFLDGLNSGKLRGFSVGGLVGAAGYQGERGQSNISSSNSLTLNISAIDASGFGDFLNRGGLSAIKQALTDDERAFGTAVGVY